MLNACANFIILYAIIINSALNDIGAYLTIGHFHFYTLRLAAMSEVIVLYHVPMRIIRNGLRDKRRSTLDEGDSTSHIGH